MIIKNINEGRDPSSDSSSQISGGALKVALPLSEECLQYLALLYAGEQSHLFQDISNSNGYTVSLDVLKAYVPPFKVTSVQTTATGFTAETLETLALSNNLPDIMLIKSSEEPLINTFSMAKFNNAFLDESLAKTFIYPDMIQNELNQDTLQAIPYYASVKMLYANASLLIDEKNISILPSENRIPFETVKILAKQITRTDKGIYGFMGLKELLAFYPMTLDSEACSYMWNGSRFNYNEEAFQNSIADIRTLVVTGAVEEFLSESQETEKYGTNDPRAINKIGFWIDDSNLLQNWNALTGSVIRRFPLQSAEQITVPLTVYSVVVNVNSPQVEEAMKFAAYLALDRDALLFRSRYEDPDGFIPPIRDQQVWERLVKTQIQGEELFSLFAEMDRSKSVAANQDYFVETTYQSLYIKYFNDILFSRKSFGTFAEEINIEANKALLTR